MQLPVFLNELHFTKNILFFIHKLLYYTYFLHKCSYILNILRKRRLELDVLPTVHGLDGGSPMQTNGHGVSSRFAGPSFQWGV